MYLLTVPHASFAMVAQWGRLNPCVARTQRAIHAMWGISRTRPRLGLIHMQPKGLAGTQRATLARRAKLENTALLACALLVEAQPRMNFSSALIVLLGGSKPCRAYLMIFVNSANPALSVQLVMAAEANFHAQAQAPVWAGQRRP